MSCWKRSRVRSSSRSSSPFWRPELARARIWCGCRQGPSAGGEGWGGSRSGSPGTIPARAGRHLRRRCGRRRRRALPRGHAAPPATRFASGRAESAYSRGARRPQPSIWVRPSERRSADRRCHSRGTRPACSDRGERERRLEQSFRVVGNPPAGTRSARCEPGARIHQPRQAKATETEQARFLDPRHPQSSRHRPRWLARELRSVVRAGWCGPGLGA